MTPVRLLRLPDAVQADALDAASATEAHRRIIQSKPFLRRLYVDSYREFQHVVDADESGVHVEIGSGGGFIKEVLPDVLTSDVVELPGVDLSFSAAAMPFEDSSLHGIFLLNCFHHIPRPADALREFERTLAPGGRVLMIEPANTVWSRFVFKRFHHEPFDPEGAWELSDGGRLTSANDALTWIVFVRDLQRVRETVPTLELVRLEYHTPIRYVASGGLSFRQLVPSWSYGAISLLEKLSTPIAPWIGMFMTVELEKHSAEPEALREWRHGPLSL